MPRYSDCEYIDGESCIFFHLCHITFIGLDPVKFVRMGRDLLDIHSFYLHMPQLDELTLCAVTLIVPKFSALPLVNVFIASSDVIKPVAPLSTASMYMVWLVPLPYVNFQQEPQLTEFQPSTARAPPMFGKPGREPNVLYPFVPMPFEPSEQATALVEVAVLSYAGSYESMTPAARLQVNAREKRTLRGLKFIAGDDGSPEPF